MFHRAIELDFKEGTCLELTFDDGAVKAYDIASLFEKYPQMEALKNRELFCSGKLVGPYGIIWNDELDIEVETVYEEGRVVRWLSSALHTAAGSAVRGARARAGLSQKELSRLTGIDQSDISKIERGLANPSVGTLERIAVALGCKLAISIE